MSNKKNIDQELEELSTVYQRGGGIGDPGLEQEIGRRIDVLMHRQIQAASKANNRVALLNLLLTALNIGVLIYQIFFR